MKRKRQNRSNQRQEVNQKKVIRCNLLKRPMFEQETCSEFTKDGTLDSNQYCKNCKHSF